MKSGRDFISAISAVMSREKITNPAVRKALEAKQITDNLDREKLQLEKNKLQLDRDKFNFT